MKQEFATVIHKEGKWYVAQAIEFGVTSQGKTLTEAKKNLIEAMELYLENEDIDILKTSEKPILTKITITRGQKTTFR